MKIRIERIQKKDFDLARRFAVEGMNLSRYATSKLTLYLYSWYFWYQEISRTTKAYGAYMDNQLAGVLLADMNGEPKLFKSVWHKLYAKVVGFVINIFFGKSSDIYESANKDMLEEFKKENTPYGEIVFFAVNPTIKGKGIGTMLLNVLETDEKGKLVYLYTDSGSTYQFYEHRGFTESGRREIVMKIDGKKVSLTCFLFSKTL